MLMIFSSCAGNLRVEKRHYRDGFYWGGREHHHSSTATTNTVSGQSVAPDQSDELRPNDSDHVAGRIDSASTTTTTPPELVHDTAVSSVIEEESVEQRPRFIPEHTVSELPPVEVPEEARRLNVLSWVAVALLVLGVIASIVAFMPFVAAGFGVLIAAAPFLILGALGLGIWIMVTARRRKLSAVNAASSNYYDKLRKRSRLVVVLASVVIVVFALFLALVIAALSTFQ